MKMLRASVEPDGHGDFRWQIELVATSTVLDSLTGDYRDFDNYSEAKNWVSLRLDELRREVNQWAKPGEK